MALAWRALTSINVGNRLAYTAGDIVPDANVALYHYDTQGLVERVDLPSALPRPDGLDLVTQAEFDAGLQARAAALGFAKAADVAAAVANRATKDELTAAVASATFSGTDAVARKDAADAKTAAASAAASAEFASTSATASAARLAFDVAKIRPTFLTTLQLQRASVMQHAIKDPASGDFYVTQATAGTTGTRETCTISRVSSAGVLLDYMELTDAGHGTAIGLQRVNGKVNLWLGYNLAPTASAVTPGTGGNDLLRFEYRPQTTPWTRDTIVAQVMPKFGGDYVIVAIDEATDTIAYRTSSGTSDVYTRRKLSEVQAGVNKTYGTVTLQQGTLPNGATITMQGFATIDDYLYRYTGNTNGTTDPAQITRYSWATGAVTAVVDTSALGVSPDGTTLGGFREPEGIAIFRDPISGLPHLTAGVTTGPTNRRAWSLFMFAPVGGDTFRGTQLKALEDAVPIGKGGKSRRIDPAITSIAALTQPGWIYLTAAEFGAMTDRPTDANAAAGYWVQTSGYDTGSGFNQRLVRNSTTVSETWIRVVQPGTGAGPWAKSAAQADVDVIAPVLATGQAKSMPAGTTAMTQLTQPGWYYLTGAQYGAMTDRPADWANSGHFIFVSGGAGTVFVQRLIRNTTTGTWAEYTRAFNTSDGNKTNWQKHTVTSTAYLVP